MDASNTPLATAAPRPRVGERCARTIVTAALALPGVHVGHALAAADTEPGSGVVAFKYLHYEDSQPGLSRITVNAPSVYLRTAVGENWAVEASGVIDSVSGATPRWQSTISGASVMHEERQAEDVKLTRYFPRSSYAVGLSHSAEHDYVSDGGSLEGSWSTDDNNRTWNLGVAGSSDRINPTNGGQAGVSNEHKRTAELMGGVTQSLSPNDIAQANLSWSYGAGYFSDPYKTLDQRPRRRRETAVLARWNHYFDGDGSTLRSSYRYYRDSYGINAHTLEFEWVKPVTDSLTFSPLLRLYSQSAATFYVDSLVDASGYPVFPDLAPGQLNSGDQRLSAFGAVSLALKADYRLDPLWSVDAKAEAYRQRSGWRLGGSGSIGLAEFRATFFEVGVTRRF